MPQVEAGADAAPAPSWVRMPPVGVWLPPALLLYTVSGKMRPAALVVAAVVLGLTV